jgi:magnesium/cobalt transport protein CorA
MPAAMIQLAFGSEYSMEHTNSPHGPGIRAEYLDFRDRTHGDLPLGQVPTALADGRFVWIDVDSRQGPPAAVLNVLSADVVRSSGLADIRFASGDREATASSLHRTDRLLHIIFVGYQPADVDRQEVLEAVVAEGFLITVHRGQNAVLTSVRRDYIHDFERYSSTPSFLLYEMCHNQIETLLATHGELQEEVERTRLALRHSTDEDALESLGRVSDHLLMLRKRVLPMRRVLEELIARKTNLVSDSTLGFIDGMVDTLERLLADIAGDREILETSLQHSLTVMSHRTNQTMNRLAVVSTIFLPLTFLCGVYGMNFEVMPEITWAHGYIYFWVLSGVITGTLVVLLRRGRLL